MATAQQKAANARAKSAEYELAADRHRSRFETWLVGGNVAAFAGLAAAFLSGNISAYILPAAVFSAWSFLFGACSGAVVLAKIGMYQSALSEHFSHVADSIEEEKPIPQLPDDPVEDGKITFILSVFFFSAGILVPLIWATAIAVSGRMPH